MNNNLDNAESMNADNAPHRSAVNRNAITHTIAVMSSKGGVGTSFVTGLLASGLAAKGHRVGILDADFTGSSIPLFFGLQGAAKIGEYSFVPHQSKSGIKIISPNLLFERDDNSIVWKEALMGQVIDQLWREVEWGTLDYLLVDMPRATSEVAVAVMQSLPFTGAVIVTTPQVINTRIVVRTIQIVQKVNVHILGVVENMAFYPSPITGKREYIFGQSRVESIANSAHAPILASLPLDPLTANLCDQGNIEDAMPDHAVGMIETFLDLVSEYEKENPAAVQARRNLTNRGYFSNVVMELIRSKENVGSLENPDAQGLFLGSCGDRMQIDLRVRNGKITDAKFMANGCGATYACGSMITRMAVSKSLEEAREISSEEVITALDGLPEDHTHCAELAVMTLREAVVDAVEGHRNRPGG